MQCEAEEISNTMKKQPHTTFSVKLKISTKNIEYNKKITPCTMQCEACHEALEGGRGGARFR